LYSCLSRTYVGFGVGKNVLVSLANHQLQSPV
jgi:hypothetical protein